MLLVDLKEGEKGVVVRIKGYGAFKKRLSEMGFIRGQVVEVVKYAPLKDPVEYRIMNYNVSLRLQEAQLVEVVSEEEYATTKEITEWGTIDDEVLQQFVKNKEKVIHVALVGNPNAGKTTFFNYASGSSERVGNYSGVTVSVKKATFRHEDYKIEIADLPGTYSLTSFSPEERYVRDYLLEEKPDIVINLIDASNMERNMFLTTQLIDMDLRVVMALNMYDELKKIRASLNHKKLGKLLGIPIIPTISSRGKGIKQLLGKVVDVYEENDTTIRHIHINYGQDMEKAIADLQKTMNEDKNLVSFASPRFLSLKLLEGDETLTSIFQTSPISQVLFKKTKKHKSNIEQVYADDINTVLTDAHYGFIAGALAECYQDKGVERHKGTRLIDTLFTNKLLGFPLFILFMYLTFYTTFTLGAYPMEWIEVGVGMLSEFLQNLIPPGSFHDLLIDGVIDGVGGVLVFMPNILILFFFISLMEDSGYMARAVFIMDKLMHKIGLHGRSFIPLVMGFGCNVPAIMATRALNNRKDRMITMLINPFMSCSARLPVYILLIATFFPENPTQMLFLIYIIGIVLAIIFARIFRKTLFRSADVPFVMELPPYRLPTVRSLLKHMWNKGVHYLKKISGVILIASIVIWALGYFPRNEQNSVAYQQKRSEVVRHYEKAIEFATVKKDELLKEKEDTLRSMDYVYEEERLKNTYIGQVGQAIEPIVRPLGFDWKIGIAILTGAAAKEIVVSTLGVLYEEGNDVTEKDVSLQLKLQTASYSSGDKVGQRVFSPRVAFSLMLFVLIYFPCIGVLAVVGKEVGWKWALFLAVYTTVLAYLFALGFYQISELFI